MQTATTLLLRLPLALQPFSLLALFFLAAAAPAAAATPTPPLRPPAVPLVACDPYFSIWSPADKLTDTNTTHWTGKPNRLTSQILIDNKLYRVIGPQPATAPALAQKTLTVLPTRTIYTFEDPAATVRLTLTFLTPALPEDIDILSRPVTYITYALESLDAAPHTIAIQFTASGDITVDDPANQLVTGATPKIPGLTTLSLGSKDQRILNRSGDQICIEWGYLYLAADNTQTTGALTTTPDYQNTFGTPATSDIPQSAIGIPNSGVPAAKATATLRFTPFQIPASSTPAPATGAAAPTVNREPGTVNRDGGAVARTLILAYDDLYSIQYLGANLRPYWRRNGWQAPDLLTHSLADYDTLRQRCETRDTELMADLATAGGPNYAALCALAYRQCLAAGKLVADANGQPLQFCKENHSNGCVATSDVFFPMSPLFLLHGPTLAKSFLVPFMNYATSPRWKYPFAPHDLGKYPLANGQVYGGGEQNLRIPDAMPVEESGNLLILFAAIAQMENTPAFANHYWPTLQKWAAYLKEKGFDPENQKCTDDFAGHLAHNVNLSIKAIVALGAYAKLCDMRGDKTQAQDYRQTARAYAQRWIKEADDGTHYRLAFDKPNTWSQKYNLVWDRILHLDLFPPEVARKETDFYLRTQNPYGLPLDSRKPYTKLDWLVWTATLTQNRADFEALTDPIIKFINETKQREPLGDWYMTDTADKKGFTARPVIGAVFIQLLYDTDLWQKYAQRDETKAANWAPLPPGYMDAKTIVPPKAAKKKKK